MGSILPGFSVENRDGSQKAAASCEIMEESLMENSKKHRCRKAQKASGKLKKTMEKIVANSQKSVTKFSVANGFLKYKTMGISTTKTIKMKPNDSGIACMTA